MRLMMDFFPGYVDFKLAGQKVSSPFVSGSNAVLVGIRYAILLPFPQVRGIVALTYLDPNGNIQTMTGTPARGTLAGANYIYDLSSQPARLSPNVQAGQMWPVAMVTTNAVQCDYVTGYGGTITVGVTASSAAITGYVFNSAMVGMTFTVPNAGNIAGTIPLVTTIAAVDGSGNGTMATNALNTVAGAAAYLGDPVPELVQVSIMRLANYYYENRTQSPDKDFLKSVKQQLGPYRDLRF